MTRTTRAVNFEPLNPPETVTLEGVQILYEPSVFGGDGTEVRKNIVFAVPPSMVAHMEHLEASIDANRRCSSLKGDALRCKINMDSVNVYDADRAQTRHPEVWRGRAVNALVALKGKWSTHTQTGYTIEVQALQLLDDMPPECPFLAGLTDGSAVAVAVAA